MASPASSSSDGERQSSAFAQLYPSVQEWVWRQGWDELRLIQEEAIPPILKAEADIVVASSTASGKTESAFLGIASRLATSLEPGIAAVYIAPLKSLLNDQHRRLLSLCDAVSAPLHRWHGDVSAAAKKRVHRDPRGVLQITPESLEGILLNHGTKVPRLFAGLRHIVVDELHAFLGNERGRQLQSLMTRIEVALGRRVQRIGLSATLGDLVLAAEGLRPGHGAEALIIQEKSGGHDLLLQIRGYREEEPRAQADENAPVDAGPPPFKMAVPEGIVAVAESLFRDLRGANHLVFANARNTVEHLTDNLARVSERECVLNEFFAYHSSLGKDHRELVEHRLRSGEQPTTAVSTSALELGLDVGEVASVAIVGAPHTVSSLRQRLGRSGRRGGPSVLRMEIIEPAVSQRTPPQERIRPRLVQAIAMTRLLLTGWCEPPAPAALHLSTLTQQVLSLVHQRGGISVADAYDVLATTGPFRSVESDVFVELLRDLKSHDLVMQLEDGTIVLGAAGEILTGHFSFYAAFTTPPEWRLMHAGRALGTLPIDQPLVVGLYIVFAGRRWRIASIDDGRRDVYVVPAKGGTPPRFGGLGGEVHDRVREEMLAVLLATDVPVYLDERARDLLDEARVHAARLGLGASNIVEFNRDTVWMPFAGDRSMNTLAVQLSSLGLEVEQDGVALTVFGARADELRSALRQATADGPADALALAATVQNTIIEKHDHYLRPALRARDYASKKLDVVGAWRVAKRALE